MRKKSWVNYVVLLILLISLSSVVILSNNNLILNKKINEKYIKKSEVYVYKLSGSVQFDEIYSKEPLTYGDLFLKAKINETSDISEFNLNAPAILNEVIFIPYNEEKVNINQINSVFDLTRFGIRKKTAENIFNFLLSKEYKVSWDDLAQINGVGSVTLKRLQRYLIIEN